MKQDRALHVQVAAAVGAMLVGRDTITLGEVETLLPSAIRAGRPTHKSMTKALVAAGWIGIRRAGGEVVYRSPEVEDDGGLGDNVGNDQLRLLIDRVMNLQDEKKGISDDIRDVFVEAKSLGFDPPGMRQVIKELRADPDKRLESAAITDLYRRSMGLSS